MHMQLYIFFYHVFIHVQFWRGHFFQLWLYFNWYCTLHGLANLVCWLSTDWIIVSKYLYNFMCTNKTKQLHVRLCPLLLKDSVWFSFFFSAPDHCIYHVATQKTIRLTDPGPPVSIQSHTKPSVSTKDDEWLTLTFPTERSLDWERAWEKVKAGKQSRFVAFVTLYQRQIHPLYSQLLNLIHGGQRNTFNHKKINQMFQWTERKRKLLAMLCFLFYHACTHAPLTSLSPRIFSYMSGQLYSLSIDTSDWGMPKQGPQFHKKITVSMLKLCQLKQNVLCR